LTEAGSGQWVAGSELGGHTTVTAAMMYSDRRGNNIEGMMRSSDYQDPNDKAIELNSGWAKQSTSTLEMAEWKQTSKNILEIIVRPRTRDSQPSKR